MGWPQDAFVGQKVVCIEGYDNYEGSYVAAIFKLTFPQVNLVYTIRAMMVEGDKLGIRVNEIVNPPVLTECGKLTEIYFNINSFKPLTEQTTETGMKILRSLLNEVKQHDPTYKETI